jgi:hydroxymethylglutaryl-CoA lyase
VTTEELVFMFEAMGVATAVNLRTLFAAPETLRAGLPGEPIYGMTPEAGLPLGFARCADERRHAAAGRPAW